MRWGETALRSGVTKWGQYIKYVNLKKPKSRIRGPPPLAPAPDIERWTSNMARSGVNRVGSW